jgi:hypothetical protein
MRIEMIKRLVRKAWIQFLIAFDDRYTVEGFERTLRKVECPENSNLLDSRSKRELTICNLFANQDQSIWNIARVLDISVGKVVVTLIEHGLIRERRVRKGRTKHERRQKPFHDQPTLQSTSPEIPAQFELPLGMSKWVMTGDLKSESPADQGSLASRGLAN